MLILVTTDKSFHRIQFHTFTPMETAAGWLVIMHKTVTNKLKLSLI